MNKPKGMKDNEQKYKMIGVHYQLLNIVKNQMLIKKHFLYIDAINEVNGNGITQQKIQMMIKQIDGLKNNLIKYKKSL